MLIFRTITLCVTNNLTINWKLKAYKISWHKMKKNDILIFIEIKLLDKLTNYIKNIW